MNTLTIEPTYRVLLGEVSHFRILQVGCGGTGSALALALGGLACHARQKGIRVELTLVDHDVIQPGNIGRQSFAAASAVAGGIAGGIAKCVDLAARLNAAYGLDVAAWPQRYTHPLGERWLSGGAERRAQVHLLIDCVDNTAARQEMARTVKAHDGSLWLLSCGNERVNGQVLMGNTGRPETIRLDKLGLCTGLPYPYLQEPGLLEDGGEETAVSCAEMAEQEAQSLMVNRLAATVAGHLVTEMVLKRQVTQMGCYFSLEPLAMRGVPVTASSLAPFRPERRS
ncbi:MAG: ThiF family adenylyltransferase [Chloroflexi bacterium]|nr:ThiF family adenylyltransferase [Chloroflexota bacterium]